MTVHLLAEWLFDGTSNSDPAFVADGAGSHTLAKIGSGLPACVTGQHGKAASFDGYESSTGLKGDATDLLAVTKGGYAIDLWARMDSAWPRTLISIESSAHWYAAFELDTNVREVLYRHEGISATPITGALTSLAAWKHYVFSVEDLGSTQRITAYVNGTAQTPVTVNKTSATDTTLPLVLFGGEAFSGEWSAWVGPIDNVRIWSGALTADQALALYTDDALPADPVVSATAVAFPSRRVYTGEDTYGIDVSTFPDLDETFSPMSGLWVVGEAIARRLQTPRGMLLFHPDYGLDLRAYLNDSIDVPGLDRLKSAIRAECLKDERVSEASSVEVVYSAAASSLLVTLRLVAGAGPFALVLKVTQATVQVLSAA